MTEPEEDRILEKVNTLDLRAKLQLMVEKDLLGPAGGEEEEIEDSPRERYLVGKLAPKGQTAPVDEQEELALDGLEEHDEGTTESKTTPIASMLPSSMGLTFSGKKRC